MTKAIVLFTFLFFALYSARLWLYEFPKFFFNRVVFRTRISRSKYHEIDKILSAHLTYYRNLSTKGKARFVNRLIRFIASREFRGMNGLKLTDEMIVVVAAAAVQLTYGLEKYRLSYFGHIYLYPDTFYHRGIKKELKGGTSPAGSVMLSWKDVVSGYSDDHDRYNLGLHEMAHALKIHALKGYDIDADFTSFLSEWLEVSKDEMEKLQEGSGSILRPYGGVNSHEFFAVCVEYFFEVPERLKKQAPELYNHLCLLLKQDPLNVRGDYKLIQA